MNSARLILRTVAFHRGSSIAVALTAAACTAVLAGALAVGDSVRYSLETILYNRLGETQAALYAPGRFFTAGLAERLSRELRAKTAPVLYLDGSASDEAGLRPPVKVRVTGVDRRFFDMGPSGSGEAPDPGQAAINRTLAAALGAEAGDTVSVRIAPARTIPGEVPLSTEPAPPAAARLRIAYVAGPERFGDFSLNSATTAPENLFVPIGWLQEKTGLPAKANMMLAAGSPQHELQVEQANAALSRTVRPADLGLNVESPAGGDTAQITSSRIFIEPAAAEAAESACPGAEGILTYFVNEIRGPNGCGFYCMVAAAEPETCGTPVTGGLAADEILINRWLAEDLAAKESDSIQLEYFVFGAAGKLSTARAGFKVKRILEMTPENLDPNLMPKFPGISGVEDCADWKPGVPIDLAKITPRDRLYWEKYRGSPKAFVTLAAGQKMWANSYGNLTAVRCRGKDPAEISRRLSAAMDPASAGLYFEPARRRGREAVENATDFGGLFAAFSFFIVVSCLAVLGLVLVFAVEKRQRQNGLLLAAGFTPRRLGLVLLAEAALPAAAGTAAGVPAGLLYTAAMIRGLNTIWKNAVGGAELAFDAEPATVLAAAAMSLACCMLAAAATLRSQVKRPARELLAGLPRQTRAGAGRGKKTARIMCGAFTAAAAASAVLSLRMESSSQAAGFFMCGTLLIAAALCLQAAVMKSKGRRHGRYGMSLVRLAARNAARRPARSLAVAGLLACGIFVVAGTAAHMHSGRADPAPAGPTGGFAFYGELAAGIRADLNDPAEKAKLGLDADRFRQVKFVQLLRHDGDDASCLNLNRAQAPPLLAVEPQRFVSPQRFRFADIIGKHRAGSGWLVLNERFGEGTVPAVADYSTVVWQLGKKTGDTIDYLDEKGRPFRILIAGVIEDSVLQGGLVISRENFTRLFPSNTSSRVLLAGAGEDSVAEAAGILRRRFETSGLVLESTDQRLARFQAVERTYLGIFQVLGSLGLVMGTVGLAMVVLRNVLDRTAELAMMRAVGFGIKPLKKMILYEHLMIIAWGAAAGAAAALSATAPVLGLAAGAGPYLSIIATSAAVGVSSLAWAVLAAAVSLRGDILGELRRE